MKMVICANICILFKIILRDHFSLELQNVLTHLESMPFIQIYFTSWKKTVLKNKSLPRWKTWLIPVSSECSPDLWGHLDWLLCLRLCPCLIHFIHVLWKQTVHRHAGLEWCSCFLWWARLKNTREASWTRGKEEDDV